MRKIIVALIFGIAAHSPHLTPDKSVLVKFAQRLSQQIATPQTSLNDRVIALAKIGQAHGLLSPTISCNSKTHIRCVINNLTTQKIAQSSDSTIRLSDLQSKEDATKATEVLSELQEWFSSAGEYGAHNPIETLTPEAQEVCKSLAVMETSQPREKYDALMPYFLSAGPTNTLLLHLVKELDSTQLRVIADTISENNLRALSKKINRVLANHEFDNPNTWLKATIVQREINTRLYIMTGRPPSIKTLKSAIKNEAPLLDRTLAYGVPLKDLPAQDDSRGLIIDRAIYDELENEIDELD